MMVRLLQMQGFRLMVHHSVINLQLQQTKQFYSGNDDDGGALAYDPNFLDVYLNGVQLEHHHDYTATDGSTIIVTSGARHGDILHVVSFGTFRLLHLVEQQSLQILYQ